MNLGVIILIGVIVIFLFLFIVYFVVGTSQKGMEKMITKYGNIAAKAQNNIITNNEEILKDTANKSANIHKDAVKTIAHSVKEGLTDNNKVYCKYCGAQIDEDSKFCKKCGKQQ